MAQTTVAINLEAKTKGTESVKSLKTQIKEATQDAAAMAQKFGEFSPQAVTAAKRVAELKDQMDGLNDKIQALHPDKFNRINTIAQGVANGFQAAQGAMALFGAESEDVQKAMLKVQGAMALAQGIEGLDKAGKQLSTLGAKGIEAFKSMTTASKVFLAGGLGLIITIIGYAVSGFNELTSSVSSTEKEMQKMKSTIQSAGDLTRLQAADLNYYNSVVQDTTKSEGEREFALGKLKEAGIATDDVTIANANSLGVLNDRTAEHIKLLGQRARAEAASQILQEKTKKLLELQNGEQGKRLKDLEKALEYAKKHDKQGDLEISLQREKKHILDAVKEAQDEVNSATSLYNEELGKKTKLEGVAETTTKKVTSTLKKNTETTSAATKAVTDATAKQAELNKRSAELLAQSELVGKTEVEKAKILAQRKFDASVEGFKEGSKEYIAAQKIFNEEVAKIDADAEAKAKELRDKQAKEREDYQKTLQDNITKANEAYFKSREFQILNSGKSEIEIQKELDALMLEQLQSNIDQQNAIYGENSSEVLSAEIELTKKKKEIYDKKDDAEIAALNEYYKKKELAAIQNNASPEQMAALQLSRMEEEKRLLTEQGKSVIDIELQIAAKKKEIYDKDAENKKKAEEAKKEFQDKTLQATYDSLSALQGILKEGSDAAKAAALLDIAIKTGVGFAQGLDIAQKGAAGTGPAAPYAFPIFYAQQIAAVLGAVSRAKSILKGGGGSGGAGGGSVSIPSAPALAPTVGGGLPDEQQFGGMGRVYVLEGDITKTQTRVRRLRNTSVV